MDRFEERLAAAEYEFWMTRDFARFAVTLEAIRVDRDRWMEENENLNEIFDMLIANPDDIIGMIEDWIDQIS